MKYNTVTLGKIEAMINKLGGEKGTQDFLAGKTEVVKRKFHQFGDDLLKGKGKLTVPDDYNHETQLDTFSKKIENSGLSYYLDLESEQCKGFKGTTAELIAGKTYAIKLFPIVSFEVKIDDCIKFLLFHDAILVGAQGLSLLYENQPGIFPRHILMKTFSKEDLFTSGWSHTGSSLEVNTHGGLSIYLYGSDGLTTKGISSSSINADCVLVCFCDLDESSED